MTAAASEPLIGVINAGSSSLKFSFYEGERRILAGQVDGLGVRPSASATGPEGGAIAPPDLGAAPPATPELLAELEALVPLAPLHEPHNLAPIRTAAALDPELPQIASFDTAFHRTAPE